MKSVFLKESKTFNKVYHEEVLFKLSQNGPLGNLLKPLTDFIKSSKQRVTLNRKTFSWTILLQEVFKVQ